MKRCRLPLLLLALLLLLPASAAPAGEHRPNLVLIFTDGQRSDAVGYSGNHAVSTPHLDALAREALILENCYVNTSICAVNRANLMAGQYPGRHGIHGFFEAFDGPRLRATVPGRLQAAGYQTAFFGKWGIGDSPEQTHAAAEVFDYWAGQPMQTCYFHEPDCRYVRFDGFRRPLDDLCDCPADARGKPGFRNRIGVANLRDPIHTDAEVIPMQVGRFLAGRDPAKPFALFLFFKSPHAPFGDFAPAVAGVTDGLAMPRPPAATLDAAGRVPPAVKASLGRGTGMMRLRRDGALDRHQRDYFRLVSSMDRGVGRVVAALGGAGVADRTVTMFTSDSGHFFSEHGLAEAWLMYEPSLRVPGFVHDPRRPVDAGGRKTTLPVITTDFSVTLLAYAGLDRPAEMTGADLRPLFDGTPPAWREDVFYDHPYGQGGSIPRTIGVRTPRFTYTRYTGTDPLQEELFDNFADPNQRNNLAGVAGHAETLATLRARCDELRDEVD
ncbi:sulfatase-like hydrolase/transferase [Phycisphaera mikurensis]|uniref:Putative sulfatase n=1 Tax=Phycisphaera mikurensis (strain NBRC 102666 / KCTC 22515 / FYK2301M01) TaxID=1142394 RepID=I0IH87_PHYMF|nr:sulfatase-like hydrolase/transferase [Phycisphaera mikurensis]MBB6440874.1 arylsulfatase A-like enzyme [Phycisphaera mikurensis]BAM04625.1 putative sulfatase [Phycisphaera mikurensis NBRC 102666]